MRSTPPNLSPLATAMMPRYLFGPVTHDYAQNFLRPFRERSECQAFNALGDLDLRIPEGMSWKDIAAQLPAGWSPDFIALYLPYTSIPSALWQAPVPLIGLAADWNLLWHDYRRLLPSCEWSFTDRAGVATLQREGLPHVSYGCLYGCGAADAEVTPPETFREIDVLFVGNQTPAIQAERLPWLERLAQLSDRVRVQIRTGVTGADYRRLLRRAKLVFNRSIRGERNQRVAEAIAAGALLLQEAGNEEVGEVLPEGAYTTYEATNLEAVILKLLADEEGRRRRVRQAQEHLADLSFTSAWERMVTEVGDRLPALQAAVQHRPALPPPWQPDFGATPMDQILSWVQDLRVPGLNPAAVPLAQRALAQLWLHGPPSFEPRYRPEPFDELRVAWERAAWRHAGQPQLEQAEKLRLLESWLHDQVAQGTREKLHAYEATLRAPELVGPRSRLGELLAEQQLDAFAVPHLEQAWRQQPWDPDTGRGYATVLRRLGDEERAEELCQRRQRLRAAAPTLVPLEGWWRPTPPSRTALASIIVLCCNQKELTAACVETLLKHTRPPYELIFVDNGSTDDTPTFLRGLQDHTGPVSVVVIRNEENRGFAAGCNQGLEAAQGEFLVLLNNDTRVTPEWLDRLIACNLHAYPQVGLVGPASNYVPPPQLVAWHDEDLERLDEFAGQRLSEFGGQAVVVPRLSGFCLLLRRDVYQRVGPLDERFGLGFFEDDDYGVRAREAGFELAFAPEVFIYHAGNQTFQGLQLDAEARLQENLERFAAKWGPDRAAGYRRTGAAASRIAATETTNAALPPSSFLPGVSACLIVKNEEANLADCLNSFRDLVAEVILIDTGSTDRTKEIAESLGARVFDFPWMDSFAAARNEGLKHARHEWIFWMDADDRLDDANRQALKEFFQRLPQENVAYSLKCVCLPDPIAKATTIVDHVRIFRNDPRLRWKYRVHEQILPAVRAAGGKLEHAPIFIHHVGYQDPELRDRKNQRNLRLLRQELAELPGDPFLHFNLGSTLLEQGQFAEALPHLHESLARSHREDSITAKLFVLLVQAYRQLGRWQAALPILQEGRHQFPEDPELLFQEGVLQQSLDHWAAAERAFRALLSLPLAPQRLASVDAGLVTYLAQHNLAVCLKNLVRLPEAEKCWQAALAARADYLPAWFGLAELYLLQQRWPEFIRVLEELAGLEGTAVEVSQLRIRAQLARREFAAARAALQPHLEVKPAELWPRVLHSHAWLQEGLDDAAAEKALLAILELAPAHGEARRNLEVLRYHQEKKQR